jgi:hypothetical protein
MFKLKSLGDTKKRRQLVKRTKCKEEAKGVY